MASSWCAASLDAASTQAPALTRSQRADDLTPNMGLWWYFFAEIFEHFRLFFLFVFHMQPVLLLLPLTLRLWRKPTVLLLIACLLTTLFKVRRCASSAPVPHAHARGLSSRTRVWRTWRSAARCCHLCRKRCVLHSLVVACMRTSHSAYKQLVCQLHASRALFIVGAGACERCRAMMRVANSEITCSPAALALAATLNPVLWHLWVERYTGNANFVLATTIVHSVALTTGVVDLASRACKDSAVC